MQIVSFCDRRKKLVSYPPFPVHVPWPPFLS